MSLEFALDIGTRLVRGLLVERGRGAPRVAHWAAGEHGGKGAWANRKAPSAEEAGRTVAEVRAALEAASGRSLKEAHVAVAGGALATGEARASFKIGHAAPLTAAETAAFEAEAVAQARASLPQQAAFSDAYCVGYRVVSARLDGSEVDAGSLEGASGSEVEFQVRATFLPRNCLEFLGTVLRAAELVPASLTLEPIAVAQWLVPPELKTWELGIVDVGARTTDVALAKDGRVESFGSAPLAGDAFTERLADAFLLDFQQAERLKREAEGDGSWLKDLFGQSRRISGADALREAAPTLNRWARETAALLKSLNQGASPRAVLLAGGGSQTPGLSEALAAELELPAGRVGHRPLELQTVFEAVPGELRKPWAVTPLGIAASAALGKGLPFARFQFNGDPVRVLELGRGFSVQDVLTAARREKVRLFGRPGLATVYSFNGARRTAKGGLGGACVLTVNGEPAGLETQVSAGDSVQFEEAADGPDGRLTLRQALAEEGWDEPRCLYNGEERVLPVEVRDETGPLADWDAPVRDRSRIEARGLRTLGGLLEEEGVDLEALLSRELKVVLDGEPRVLKQCNHLLKLNGKDAPLDTALAPGDKVEFEAGLGFRERVADLIAVADGPRTAAQQGGGAVRVLLNGQWAPLDRVEKVWVNGVEVGMDGLLSEGAIVALKRLPPCATLGEALVRLGFGPWVEADRLAVFLNGAAAGPEAALADGDSVDVALAPRRG